MKARTTHETICPHNGQPRKRRHGFRELEDPPALPPAGFGGGPGGAHLLSGGYHFPSEACHQPSPWEMSLTGHHPPCGSFRPPQGVGIALNVDPGPDRRNNDGPLRRQPLPHGATWPTSNRLPISIDSAPSVVASGTELACLVTLVGARRRIAASRSGCWGCGRRCCGRWRRRDRSSRNRRRGRSRSRRWKRHRCRFDRGGAAVVGAGAAVLGAGVVVVGAVAGTVVAFSLDADFVVEEQAAASAITGQADGNENPRTVPTAMLFREHSRLPCFGADPFNRRRWRTIHQGG